MKTYAVVLGGEVVERRFSAREPGASGLCREMQRLCDRHPGSRWGQVRSMDGSVDASFLEMGTADPRVGMDDLDVATPHGGLHLTSVQARLRGYRAWRASHQEAGFCGWIVRGLDGLYQAHMAGSPPWILSAGAVPWRSTLDDACGYLAGIAAARAEAKRS